MRKDHPRTAICPGEEDVASGCDASTRAKSRSSPQIKARKVLMLERARQQTAIRQMEAVRVERVIVGNVLVELLSDPAFVALLRSQGFVTMPRRLRDNLEGRSP
jgi:hypothetical protein